MKVKVTWAYLRGEGGQLPTWYGRAWRDPMRAVDVCFPIPLHWVARWARQVWYWFKRCQPWQTN